ncbi:MAG: MFS transporter [Halanaerobium sp.]
MDKLQSNNKLPLSIQVLYGIGVSYAVVDQIFAQWVLYYYLPPQASNLRPIMAPLFISIALVISRFFDMIFDPLVGYFSDQLDSRWGRRIPFIAVGALPLILSTVAFFYPPKTGGMTSFLYLTIVGSLFFIFYTIVGAPYNAMIPEISQSREDRLNLSTWQSVFRLLYTAVAMILPGFLISYFGQGNDEQGIRLMVIALGVFALIGMLITVFTIDERKYSGHKKSNTNLKESIQVILKNKSFILYLFGFMFFFLGFNILRASINYYVEEVMGFDKIAITTASALLFAAAGLSFYPINRLAKKINYKKPMQFSLLLLIIFSLALSQVNKLFPAEAGFFIFAVMGIPVAGAAFIFPPAMLSEISAASAKREKTQIEGLFFGIQGFFLKLSFLISIAILPLILVSGSDVSILNSIVREPQGVQQLGVYRTSIFAAFFFFISLIFYSLYQEE